VRTLHHYDEIGLLRPSGRTVAGHRRYSRADTERLRQILVYRELDFSLAETYIADERFRATYDTVAPGLAQYVHDAVIANAEANGA
jgi:DNA-binding transcriptional MerR regulator